MYRGTTAAHARFTELPPSAEALPPSSPEPETSKAVAPRRVRQAAAATTIPPPTSRPVDPGPRVPVPAIAADDGTVEPTPPDATRAPTDARPRPRPRPHGTTPTPDPPIPRPTPLPETKTTTDGKNPDVAPGLRNPFTAPKE